jgi:exopolysaccharide biosynthesis WecB/TagA/CpsF family protein
MNRTFETTSPPMLTVGVRVDAIESLDSVTAAMTQAFNASRPFLMTFANPATAIAVKRRPLLGEMLEKFDMVAPDGIGMAIAIKLLHGQRALRISFDTTSLAPKVFQFAIQHRLSIVLVGGAPGIALTAKEKIIAAYPGVQIIGVFDGYADATETTNAIKALAPSIVIAGMGVFAQELMLLNLVSLDWLGMGFTCGGYLDQLSTKGTDYYPAWIDKHNLRFAYRLVKEPRRLGSRYLIEYPMFGVALAKAWFGKRS